MERAMAVKDRRESLVEGQSNRGTAKESNVEESLCTGSCTERPCSTAYEDQRLLRGETGMG